jgi:serine/threonine protein kinase
LGKYEIRNKLGEGGMGAVYLAFDPMIEREVAIKVLPPHVASKPKALDRFLSEARATGKLSHPNVVAIYDIANEENVSYIVMELVRGGSGSEFIQSRSVIDWRQACEIAADACDGLAAAHAAGLVHRDIKPDNLMLTNEGVVKVVDFGLSKLVDAAKETQLGLTSAGQILGTPSYMSPEQFQGQSVDARSDVYSMGGTLYSLLTGQAPYSEASNMIQLMTSHLQKPPPDPVAVNSEVPASCRRIVEKAMAKKPEQRYRDAGELAAALREVLSGASDSEQVLIPQVYRPLESVVVVEPSKMQAMMLEKALKNAGASVVAICTSAGAAERECASKPPDLLITAMQLTDAKGIDLLRRLREDRQQGDTVLVLNSSDSNIGQLAEVGQSGPLAVVSKKTKADELLRALHACTFLDIPNLSATKELDPTTLRLGFVCDAARIPDPIAALVRQANLLDVQVTTFDELAAGKGLSGTIDLVIALRTAGDATKDNWLYTDLLSRVKLEAKALAAVQVDGERLTLRAVQRGDFTAVSRCQLDEARMLRVVQLCRSP